MLCTGTKSEMAHMWAQWLPNPCRLGGPQCSARGQNQKLPTCGHCGYLTPAVSGVPNALHGDKIRNGPHVGTVATQPLPSRGSPMLCMGTKSEMAHMWAQWLPNPCRLGGPQCSARGQNQKWPTCGHSGYPTPAVSGVPNALHELRQELTLFSPCWWRETQRGWLPPPPPSCDLQPRNREIRVVSSKSPFSPWW